MVEQQQERNLGIAALAALSLAGWLAIVGLLAFYRCSGEMCGFALLVPLYLFVGTGALLGIAAWLGATVGAVRRHDGLSALSIGLLLPVNLGNAFNYQFVSSHAVGSWAATGSWAVFVVVSATLLATSVTSRQTTRRLVAVAGLVLAVALLVASNLVD